MAQFPPSEKCASFEAARASLMASGVPRYGFLPNSGPFKKEAKMLAKITVEFRKPSAVEQRFFVAF
jgi:uncharacterized protein YecE (DUF72 family)